MYTIIKAHDIDAPQNTWELMKFSNSVEDILQDWVYFVDNLKICHKSCPIQPWDNGHSPYEVTVTTTNKGIALSAKAYIKGIAYKLVTK